jgi:phage/plasmid-associated DNA primase
MFFIKFIIGRYSSLLQKYHLNGMVDFAAKFITLLIYNDISDCDDIDNAFSERLRCLNYLIEFVDDPNKDKYKSKY